MGMLILNLIFNSQAKEEELQMRKRELEERRNSLDSEQVRSLNTAIDKVKYFETVFLVSINYSRFFNVF
jgi:hypothetical protein